MKDMAQVSVDPIPGSPRLMISFSDGSTVGIPLSDQVALVLNAGGWMMREHSARLFEKEAGGDCRIARVLRSIPVAGIPTTK